MNNIRKIAYLGIGIALYVVLSMTVKIPLVGHIQTDLGYIAFGAYLYLFGIPAVVVGVVGCLLESIIISGWVPIGWMLGQLAIGLICGFVYKKTKDVAILIMVTALAVFIGVGVIKTVVECKLYSIPFAVKFAKNSIATVADMIPMIVGCLLARFKFRKVKK